MGPPPNNFPKWKYYRLKGGYRPYYSQISYIFVRIKGVVGQKKMKSFIFILFYYMRRCRLLLLFSPFIHPHSYLLSLDPIPKLEQIRVLSCLFFNKTTNMWSSWFYPNILIWLHYYYYMKGNLHKKNWKNFFLNINKNKWLCLKMGA